MRIQYLIALIGFLVFSIFSTPIQSKSNYEFSGTLKLSKAYDIPKELVMQGMGSGVYRDENGSQRMMFLAKKEEQLHLFTMPVGSEEFKQGPAWDKSDDVKCVGGSYTGLQVLDGYLYAVCVRPQAMVVTRLKVSEFETESPSETVIIAGKYYFGVTSVQSYVDGAKSYLYIVTQNDDSKVYYLLRVALGELFSSESVQSTSLNIDSAVVYQSLSYVPGQYLYLGGEKSDKDGKLLSSHILQISVPDVTSIRQFTIDTSDKISLREIAADTLQDQIVYAITKQKEENKNDDEQLISIYHIDLKKDEPKITRKQFLKGEDHDVGMEFVGRKEDSFGALAVVFDKDMYLVNASQPGDLITLDKASSSDLTMSALVLLDDEFFVFGFGGEYLAYATTPALPQLKRPKHFSIPSWVVILLAVICIGVEYAIILTLCLVQQVIKKRKAGQEVRVNDDEEVYHDDEAYENLDDEI